MEILGLVDISTTWIVVIGLVLTIYLYGKRRNSFLKKYGIDGPEPTIYVGNLLQLLGKVEFRSSIQKKYGSVFSLYLGGFPVVNVSDPEMIKEILIKDFQNFSDRMTVDLNNYPVDRGLFFESGNTWKRLRHISSPTFSGAKLRLMCDEMNLAAETLTKNLLKAAEEDRPILIKDYFGGFTMDAIASTAFGIHIDSQNDLGNLFIQRAKEFFSEVNLANPGVFLGFIFPELAPILKALGVSTFPKKCLKYFSEFVSELIDQRKAEAGDGKKRTDFLQMIIDSEDDGSLDGAGSSSESKKMTKDEILGQALLFLVAGYETTANTLHFAAYALATNPEIQDRLIAEVDDVLGKKDPDYDNIGDLKLTENVINETLRMYPVVPAVNRSVDKTVTIKGYTLPKGSFVSIPTITIHRDPANYPDPDTFNPDRWERKSEMDPNVFLTFGLGPRHCLGMRLALVEMKIALAHVLRKIKFVPNDDTPAVLGEQDMSIPGVLATKKPLKLKIKAR